MERIVTIARAEEDKFVGSVLEWAVKFTIIVEKKTPWVSLVKRIVTITSAGKNEFSKYVGKRSVSKADLFRLHEQV